MKSNHLSLLKDLGFMKRQTKLPALAQVFLALLQMIFFFLSHSHGSMILDPYPYPRVYRTQESVFALGFRVYKIQPFEFVEGFRVYEKTN